MHVGSSFVTLTYAPKFEPVGATLAPKHVQDWLKRLRKAICPAKIRFFLVGEYGDDSGRPHYHLALFGIAPFHTVKGLTLEQLLLLTWGKGYVHVGDFNKDSAQYIAGYVTKKMTSKDDERLNGRYPEFARMSNRPGIGAGSMLEVGRAVMSDAGLDDVFRRGDVVSRLKIGGKSVSIGRYLRRVLRGEVGMAKDAPKDSGKKFAAEMFVLLEEARLRPGSENKSNAEIVVDIFSQKMLNLESRSKISRRKSL